MHSNTGFRLLDHTADIGIEAWGPSQGDVFIEMAKGLRRVIFGTSPAADSLQHKVTLKGDNTPELLVAWLNEIIYLFETKQLVPAVFQIRLIGEENLQATIYGERFKPTRHRIERQAKAATYHQLRLEETAESWYARAFIDL